MCPFSLIFYALIAFVVLGGGTGSITTLLNSLLGGTSL